LDATPIEYLLMPPTTTPHQQDFASPGLWAAPQDEAGWVVTRLQATHPSIAINGIRMASPHAPWRDAQLALPGLLRQREVHLYGCALGHVPTLLLKSSECPETLKVHILNAQAFDIQKVHMAHTDWLDDPRVQLRMAQASDKPDRQAALHISLPDLQLIDPALWRLRDRLHAHINQGFVDSAFQAHDVRLQNLMHANATLLQTDLPVHALFGRQVPRTAHIIGSGPSLEHSIERLRGKVHGPQAPWVIAVDTAFAALQKAGIPVNCVVSIEKKIHARWLPTEHSDGVALVYSPVVPNDVLLAWKGPRYASFTQTALHRRAPHFDAKSCLFCGGSVVHTATDLAVLMGFADICFWGVDLSYPNGKTHAYWPSGELGGHPTRNGHWVIDGLGQRVPSSPSFANYLAELEDQIARHPDIRFFNSSQQGAAIAGTHYLPE
jgi:hypothetical protein